MMGSGVLSTRSQAFVAKVGLLATIENGVASMHDFALTRTIERTTRSGRLPLLLSAPVCTALAFGAAAALLVPSVTLALQYDRAAIVAGEWWRLITGHLTHWNGEHLFWDAAMFVVLGAILERRSRRHFVACLIASTIAISATVWLLHPELERYRGLSGVDTALFAMVAVDLLRDALRQGDRGQKDVASNGPPQGQESCSAKLATTWRPRWPKKTPDPDGPANGSWLAFLVPAVLLTGLIGKIAFEFVSADTLFVNASGAGFTPVPLAHLVGAIVGMMLVPRRAGA